MPTADTNKLGDVVLMPVSSFNIKEGIVDLAFSATDLQMLNTAFWISGVVPHEKSGDYSTDTSAKVSILNGLNIQIAPGRIHVDGTICFWNNALLGDGFAIDPPDALGRIDSVVIRRNLIARRADVVILKGTPANNPVPPEIQYNQSGVADLRLADISVKTGIAQLSSGDISDKRTFIRARLGVDEELASFQSQIDTALSSINTVDTKLMNIQNHLIVRPLHVVIQEGGTALGWKTPVDLSAHLPEGAVLFGGYAHLQLVSPLGAGQSTLAVGTDWIDYAEVCSTNNNFASAGHFVLTTNNQKMYVGNPVTSGGVRDQTIVLKWYASLF